jgi:hypothetical protein
MGQNRIDKQWREEFVRKLQERYGLTGEKARKKVEAWFESHRAPEPGRVAPNLLRGLHPNTPGMAAENRRRGQPESELTARPGHD